MKRFVVVVVFISLITFLSLGLGWSVGKILLVGVKLIMMLTIASIGIFLYENARSNRSREEKIRDKEAKAQKFIDGP